MPADNVKDLIALGKAKPGQLNYGTYGVGSSGHLNMEMFKAVDRHRFRAGALQGRDAGLARRDGRAHPVDVHLDRQRHAAGQGGRGEDHRGSALPKRMALLPDVPTIAETVPGFTAVSWFGLFGPAGMPADVVGENQCRGAHDLRRAERAAGLPRRAIFRIARQFARRAAERIRTEEPRWRKIIRDAHISVE